MQPIQQIDTKESPRVVLTNDFKSSHGELPIRGGWGYSKEDACIIDKNDPVVDPALPFSGIRIEKTFVEMRIYEEMVLLSPNDDELIDIDWKLLRQELIHDNDKNYDRLSYEITALSKAEGNEMVQFTREFWFDITSFFGK